MAAQASWRRTEQPFVGTRRGHALHSLGCGSRTAQCRSVSFTATGSSTGRCGVQDLAIGWTINTNINDDSGWLEEIPQYFHLCSLLSLPPPPPPRGFPVCVCHHCFGSCLKAGPLQAHRKRGLRTPSHVLGPISESLWPANQTDCQLCNPSKQCLSERQVPSGVRRPQGEALSVRLLWSNHRRRPQSPPPEPAPTPLLLAGDHRPRGLGLGTAHPVWLGYHRWEN